VLGQIHHFLYGIDIERRMARDRLDVPDPLVLVAAEAPVASHAPDFELLAVVPQVAGPLLSLPERVEGLRPLVVGELRRARAGAAAVDTGIDGAAPVEVALLPVPRCKAGHVFVIGNLVAHRVVQVTEGLVEQEGARLNARLVEQPGRGIVEVFLQHPMVVVVVPDVLAHHALPVLVPAQLQDVLDVGIARLAEVGIAERIGVVIDIATVLDIRFAHAVAAALHLPVPDPVVPLGRGNDQGGQAQLGQVELGEDDGAQHAQVFVIGIVEEGRIEDARLVHQITGLRQPSGILLGVTIVKDAIVLVGVFVDAVEDAVVQLPFREALADGIEVVDVDEHSLGVVREHRIEGVLLPEVVEHVIVGHADIPKRAILAGGPSPDAVALRELLGMGNRPVGRHQPALPAPVLLCGHIRASIIGEGHSVMVIEEAGLGAGRGFACNIHQREGPIQRMVGWVNVVMAFIPEVPVLLLEVGFGIPEAVACLDLGLRDDGIAHVGERLQLFPELQL
jgi:hypothetical protein